MSAYNSKKRKKANFKADIKPEELSSSINEVLTVYSNNVTQAIKNCVVEVAKNTVDTLHQTSPKMTGDYARAWAYTILYDGEFERRASVNIPTDDYRLIHLLEFGHIIKNRKNGATYGRVSGIPHVMPAYEKAQKEYTEKVKEAIKDENSTT